MIESELIREAQEGDQQAFRQLVEIYSPITERTARALLAGRTMAEDAVRDAWLSAWRGLKRFDATRSFRSWILEAVSESCSQVAGREQPPSPPAAPGSADRLNESPASGGAEGYDEELEAALSKLPPDCRRMLQLRYSAGLELEEIADVLRAPLGTVRSRLPQALEILQAKLEQGRLQARETAEVR